MNGTNEIFTLLTSQDKNEIRQSIKSLIIKRIEDDLDDYDEYECLIDCDEVQNVINDTLRDLIQEIINEHKQEIKQCILNNLNKSSK